MEQPSNIPVPVLPDTPTVQLVLLKKPDDDDDNDDDDDGYPATSDCDL